MKTLTPAAQAILRRLNCRNANDLAGLPEKRVREAWRCGDKAVAELRAWLHGNGLDFWGAQRPQEALPFDELNSEDVELPLSANEIETLQKGGPAPAMLHGDKITCPCGHVGVGTVRTRRLYCGKCKTWRDVK